MRTVRRMPRYVVGTCCVGVLAARALLEAGQPSTTPQLAGDAVR